MKKAISNLEEIVIIGILEKAQQDIEFREQILKEPQAALTDYKIILSPASFEALTMFRRVALEELGIDIRKYREHLRDNGAKIGM